MKFLAVGILGAVFSWILNRFLISKTNLYGLIIIAPIMEEILKTGGAIIFKADILLVHATFGTIEAIDDINRGARNISAGIVSFLGHLMFGYIATIFYQGGGIIWALIGSSIVHILWNLFVVLLVNIKGS